MPRSELRSYDDFSYSAVYKEKGNSGSLSPFTYLCTILIIALLGLTTLYSSSFEKAIAMGLPHYYFFFRNLIAGIIGLFFGFLLKFIPIKALKKGYLVLFPFSLIILAASLLPSLAEDGWIVINGMRIINPSSFALLSLPFMIAGLVDDDELQLHALILPVFFAVLLMILALFSGGISWYLLLAISLIVSLRIKGMRALQLIALFIVISAMGIAISVMFPEHILSPVFHSMFPVNDPAFYDQDLFAARSAIQNGSVAGAGLGKGIYKLGTLSDPEGIFIFASYSEELGLLGGLFIIFLLLLVSIIGARTVFRAQQRNDSSSATLVAGLTLYIVLRAAANLMYVAGMLPLPGVLLPFFSYSPSDEFLIIIAATVLYRLIFVMGRMNEKR